MPPLTVPQLEAQLASALERKDWTSYYAIGGELLRAVRSAASASSCLEVARTLEREADALEREAHVLGRHQAFLQGFVAARNPANPQDSLLALAEAEIAYAEYTSRKTSEGGLEPRGRDGVARRRRRRNELDRHADRAPPVSLPCDCTDGDAE